MRVRRECNNGRTEQVKIVMIDESVPHSSGLWEEAAKVELTFHQRHTTQMGVARYSVRGKAGLAVWFRAGGSGVCLNTFYGNCVKAARGKQ